MSIYLVLHHYCLTVMDMPFSAGYSCPGGYAVNKYVDMCMDNKDELTTIMVNRVSIKENDFLQTF